MKSFLSFTFLVTGAVLWMAARPTDVLTDLKLTTEQVHNQVFYQLSTENPTTELPGKLRQVGKQLSAGARVSAVQAMGALVRTYVQSTDFRSRYDHWMRDRYRVSDEQTAEAQHAEKASMNDVQTAVDQQLAQTSAVFDQMPPATLAMMLQQQLMQLQQQLINADAPGKAALTRDLTVLRQLQPLATTKPAEFKTKYIAFMNRYMARQMGQGLEGQEERLAENKAKAADYRTRLAQYKANANPNIAIKKRLTEFITLAESVDFDAKVEKQGYKLEFVRPDYRNQSDEWKLLYRIGREPVLTARDVARTWLGDLK
ncbi:hypothetical protein [Spirosoma areae]